MACPQIIKCEIVPRTTQMSDGKRYAFTEIFLHTAAGIYYSRTWEVVPDNDFMRTYQIEQFKRRWEADERAKTVARSGSENPRHL